MQRLAEHVAPAFAVLLVVGGTLLGPGGAFGQAAPRTLTLPEAIAVAREHSPTLDAAQAQLDAARAQKTLVGAQMLPRFSLTGSIPGLDRSINEITQDDGSVEYVAQSRLSSDTRFEVRERLPWTGTEIFISTRLARLDVFGDREFSQWNAAPVSVGLSQPLFQFNDMKWTRRLQPLRLEVAQRARREERVRLAEAVARAFFDASLAQAEVDIAAFNRTVNDTILALTRRRFQIGTAPEREVIKSELELVNAREALSEARGQAETSVGALRAVLGLDPGARLELVLPTQLPARTPARPAEAVEQARRNRTAFAQQRLQVLQARREVAQAESQTGFQASITASFGLNQQADRLWGAYRQPLNQQRLDVSFNLPIFAWGEGEARVEAARAALQQAKAEAKQREREVTQEVRAAAAQLPRLRRQVRLAATADTLAAERFEAVRRQYRVGNLDLTDFFNAQQERSQARRRRFEQLRAYWVTYYQLQRQTLTDSAGKSSPP